MISEGVRFDKISILTLRIRTGLSKQCKPRSDAAERIQTFTETVMYLTSSKFVISPRTGVYMPVCQTAKSDCPCIGR